MSSSRECTKCKREKSLTEFGIAKRGLYGRRAVCNTCRAAYAKEFNKNESKEHRDLRNKKRREHDDKNRIHRRESCKKWHSEHRFQLRNKERKRYNNDPIFRIRKQVRQYPKDVIKGTLKEEMTVTSKIGTTREEFLKYIESQFIQGMTWENYGIGGWDIDHIKPLAAFNLLEEGQIEKANHYTNLRPIWAIENSIKGSRYEE